MNIKKGNLLKIIPRENFLPRLYATAEILDITPIHFLKNEDVLLALENYSDEAGCIKVCHGEKFGYIPRLWLVKFIEEDIVETE